MKQNVLRIGIIGAGMMGRSHQRSVTTYGAHIVAVHDIRTEIAEKMATEVDAEVATDDLGTFFDRQLDGVVVATPPPVRLEPVRMACERGIHMMIEKPPALTLAEGRACLERIERAGVFAAVGFQLRYAPLYERLKCLVADQTIHLVRTVCTIDYYLTFRMSPWFLQNRVSGGPIAEQAIHLLDCVRFVMGNPRAVRAHALAIKNMAHDRAEFDAENAIQMTYELDNGVFGTHMNHCGTERFSFDFDVVGPHLCLHASTTGNRITGYLNGRDLDESVAAENSLGLDKTGAWLRAIETGDGSLIRSDFADSLQTLALVEAAVKSRNTGRFVRVEEVML
jgi:predicted dehydrogenase